MGNTTRGVADGAGVAVGGSVTGKVGNGKIGVPVGGNVTGRVGKGKIGVPVAGNGGSVGIMDVALGPITSVNPTVGRTTMGVAVSPAMGVVISDGRSVARLNPVGCAVGLAGSVLVGRGKGVVDGCLVALGCAVALGAGIVAIGWVKVGPAVALGGGSVALAVGAIVVMMGVAVAAGGSTGCAAAQASSTASPGP